MYISIRSATCTDPPLQENTTHVLSVTHRPLSYVTTAFTAWNSIGIFGADQVLFLVLLFWLRRNIAHGSADSNDSTTVPSSPEVTAEY